MRETGFDSKAVPGMAPAGATAIAKTLGQTQAAKGGAERQFERLSSLCKITNRAEKGYVKHFRTSFDGVIYPDGADEDDNATWLNKGETMTVSLEVALHICGNFLDPKLPDKQDIIARYGGWEYEGIRSEGLSGGPAPVNIIGPPVGLPDLVVIQVDQRGRELGSPFALYDEYTKGFRPNQRQRKETAARDKELLVDRIAEYA